MARLFSAVFAASACVAASTTLAEISEDLAAGLKERPVMKVVRLLQDMSTELQRDLDDDKAVHEKLDCWCKTNEREKTAAIETGEASETSLKAFLKEAAEKMAELKTKRDATLDEVNKNEKALQDASSLRMKEAKAAHDEEVELTAAIQACQQALVVLGKHNRADFAQLRSVAQQLQSAQVLELGRRAGRTMQVAALKSLLLQAESSPSFLGVPGYESYSSQSGQVFGVLSQMKEDFEKDLSETQAKEKKAVAEYALLKAAKREEIAAGRKLQAELDAEIAELKEKHAQAFKELEDVQAQLELDRTFLAKLKKKCAESGAEFEKRVNDRLEEIAAVEDTIKILNDDAAFENFDKTVNSAAFVQTAFASASRDRQRHAAELLSQAAARTGSPELALLAVRAQRDSFKRVLEEIDKMIVQLKKQQQDEVEHRDWCTEEINKNKLSTEEAYAAKAKLETQIADLEKTIDNLKKEIETTKKTVAEMQEQMKRASETREAENAEFQQTVTDQRLTQMILRKALDRMQQVYAMLQQGDGDGQPGAPHIQTSATKTDPGNGPARFTKYEKHAGGGRVLRMLEEVIADSQKTEDEALSSEYDSQGRYEEFMKDSNKAIEAYSKNIVNMQGAKAKAEEEHIAAKDDLKATMKHLEELHETLGGLKKSCDYLLDNFSERQDARTAEIDALNEAKSILSGAK